MFKLIIILAFGWLVTAWSLTVTTGIMHDNWWHLMPPMGGETALTLTGIAFLVALIISALVEITKSL